MLGRRFKIVFYTTIFSVAVSSSGHAADDSFVNLTCKMGSCTWYRLANRIEIRPTETGRLVGATFEECTTSTKSDEDYPKTYQCKPIEVRSQDYVANCSLSAPSVALKTESGEWGRTKLSISEDAEFGYNRSAIATYLRICHDFVRGQESLDMVGAKFGYRSRAKQIQESDQDTLASIADLTSERGGPARSSNAAPAREEGFQTPSRNIFCQVFRFDKPYSLRCDIMNLEGSIPPRPSECRDTDWGQAFEVAADGIAGHRICYTDTVMSETLEILPYGVAFRSKEFTCKSETTGVTCINAGGHGFFISKRVQTVF